ncbi:MAG TPA: hypothetical protein VJZ71_13705 [Phycisphaerae bacterium]|nr:hypothetical protein [Phycisphaerae bacterium]
MDEKEVLRKFGAPNLNELKQANAIVGELRSALQAKVANGETEIKELYYKFDAQERIFWLTQRDGEWRVISDVSIPRGVAY